MKAFVNPSKISLSLIFMICLILCSSAAYGARSDVEAFVTRFYQLCLDRNPEPAGLDGWVNALLAGALTGSDVANGFIFSDEFFAKNTSNEDFVLVLYRAFFDREPDPMGWSGWIGALYGAQNRSFVLDGFISSQEFYNLCAKFGITAESSGSGGGGTSTTWEIVNDSGNTATLTVVSSGSFTGTGWTGSAPGCGDYDMPITNGFMSDRSMTFDISASYCSGGGTISGSCSGTLNSSFQSATSASGTCSGTIADPLGNRSFVFSWASTKTSGGETTASCDPGQVNLEPKIEGSLTDLTCKITTTCEGTLNGIVCFEGGSESQCEINILYTDTNSSIAFGNVTSSFDRDLILPDGVEEVNFLYCDSGSLSLTIPRTCSDGSAPKIMTAPATDCTESSGNSIPQQDSTITFHLTDNCNDGQQTNIRFFDFDNNWRWPSATSYYILESYGTLYAQTLSCSQGSMVCYGATSEDEDKYWGVALTGTASCSTCCFTCDGGQTSPISLTCN